MVAWHNLRRLASLEQKMCVQQKSDFNLAFAVNETYRHRPHSLYISLCLELFNFSVAAYYSSSQSLFLIIVCNTSDWLCTTISVLSSSD